MRDMMRAGRAHRVGASVSRVCAYLVLVQLVHPCAQVGLVMRASNTSAPSSAVQYHAHWCAACGRMRSTAVSMRMRATLDRARARTQMASSVSQERTFERLPDERSASLVVFGVVDSR